MRVSLLGDTCACQSLAFWMMVQIFCMCPDRRGLGHDNCSLVGLGNCEHVVKTYTKYVSEAF